MSTLLNNDSLRLFFKVLVISIFLKALSMVAIYMLPKSSYEKSIKLEDELDFKRYRIDRSMALLNAKKEEPKKKKEEPKKPIYKLDSLELKAIFANKSGEGWIIVKDKNDKKAKSVFLSNGDEFKGYTLKKINQASAIFMRDSKEYSLEMKKKDTIKDKIKKDEVEIQEDDVVRVVSKREVDRYTKNYDEIWKNITINEIMKNGKIVGFKVEHIKKGTIFEKLGLKAGDIIEEVNGQKIRSYADAFNIYKNIKDIEVINIKLKEIMRRRN